MALTSKERDINIMLVAAESAMLQLYKNLRESGSTVKDLTLAKNNLWAIQEMQNILQRAE
jgi:hypothetical protein